MDPSDAVQVGRLGLTTFPGEAEVGTLDNDKERAENIRADFLASGIERVGRVGEPAAFYNPHEPFQSLIRTMKFTVNLM